MKVYVNENSEIKDVGSTLDTSLIELTIKDGPENPFEGWSTAKICCYKVTVQNGYVTMYTPYVDSTIIGHIDQLGKEIDAVTPYTATETANTVEEYVEFLDVPKGVIDVFVDDPEEQGIIFYVTSSEGIVKVFFDDPLKYAVDVTIKVS